MGRGVVVSLLVALLLWGFSHWRYTAGQDAANQYWLQEWTKRNAADTAARADREARERVEERRRQMAADEEQKHAAEELAKVQRNADAASRAADGLQQQLTALQRQLGRSETGRLSAVAAASQARGEAALLLAQLLSESDKAAGEYAEAADRAYAAGSSCERTYDKVTGMDQHLR